MRICPVITDTQVSDAGFNLSIIRIRKYNIGKMKILVADDEKEFVALLVERLSGQGHDVTSAPDGAQALELMKANNYELIFVDHNMPELTGLELAKYAKANGIKAKIVMVTGYEHMSGSFAKILGVDEYLTKPVMIRDIDAVVKKYSTTGNENG